MNMKEIVDYIPLSKRPNKSFSPRQCSNGLNFILVLRRTPETNAVSPERGEGFDILPVTLNCVW